MAGDPRALLRQVGRTLEAQPQRQITDIEVLQQAEQSLQKAGGGFSFFGGRQDKCTNAAAFQASDID
jgi:hypothetical protein